MRNTTITEALNCIKIMKQEGAYQGHKIGILNRDLQGDIGRISGCPDYKKGEIVLYKPESVKERVTIETPLSQGEINERKAENNLIRTIRTMVCVPQKYVREAKFMGIIPYK